LDRLWAVMRTTVPPVLAGFLAIVVWGKSPIFAASVGTGDGPVFRLIPEAAAMGDVAMVEIANRQPVSDIQLRFHDTLIPLFDHPRKGPDVLIGLIAIPYHNKPGTETISLGWRDRKGKRELTVPLTILSRRFKSEKLQVAPSRVTPAPKDVERIKREGEEVRAVYAASRPRRLWNEPFRRPVKGLVTSPYGTRRLLNGKLKSYHGGVDLRAATGSPIYAANAGSVVLAKNLFYSGNIVILDHGSGLFTTYAHLSRIDVAPGRLVEKGQVIGLAGATGRVNGPHLHWGVKVNGVNVSPLHMLQTLNSLFAMDATGTAEISQPPIGRK
jgi:murein DD-endopeptidase MepM/ murein hydrolase activator NlpD